MTCIENLFKRIRYVEVQAEPRYWEDTTLDGESDEDGAIPLRKGDCWCPVIDLASGQVLGWPAGLTARVHYKVCDAGEYWLLDEHQARTLKWRGAYVPDSLLCVGDTGWGDYIIFTLGADGLVQGWSSPSFDPDAWEPVFTPTTGQVPRPVLSWSIPVELVREHERLTNRAPTWSQLLQRLLSRDTWAERQHAVLWRLQAALLLETGSSETVLLDAQRRARVSHRLCDGVEAAASQASTSASAQFGNRLFEELAHELDAGGGLLIASPGPQVGAVNASAWVLWHQAESFYLSRLRVPAISTLTVPTAASSP